MYKVAILPQYELAITFVNYMKEQNVNLKIINNQGFEIWLENEKDLTQVEVALKQFINNPYAPQFQSTNWKVDYVPPQKYTSRSPIKWANIVTPAGKITLIVAIISVFIYLIKLFFNTETILFLFSFPSNKIQMLEIWRWITPIFLHFSFIHIAFNLMWWWYLGGMVEKNIGKGKLLEILILAGVISNFCQSLFSGAYFGGLSGVIYALMAYIWLIGEKKPERGIYFERPMMFIAFIWLLLGFINVLGPIANIAHLVGLLVGLALGVADIMIRTEKREH